MIAQTLFSLFPTMAPGTLPGAMVDSLQTTQADSGLVPSPLPRPVVHVVQWIFQRPGWVMISGIVLGARVPIVLTSRADSAETRTASTAVAMVMAHAKRKKV